MSFLTRRAARRLGPLGVALTAYDVWRRLPAKQRKQLLAHGQKYGLRAVKIVKEESAKLQSRRA
jgi:hypothetical protein